MDIKHVLWTNPLRPAYRARDLMPNDARAAAPLSWESVDAGVRRIGHGGRGFAFDNEEPAHRVFVEPFRLGSRLVTNGEYLAFIEDGGYARATLWLSNGWATVQERRWTAPLYWERSDDGWSEFTFAGTAPLEPAAPVCHVSYFEADAFARWAGCRLPTEAEWECVAADRPVTGPFVEGGQFHPMPAVRKNDVVQLYGDAWQWTRSPYVAYPGYVPPAGAVGEYNGKWMCDQWVLRGASCATPRTHARLTYRNFFPSDARWAFAGIRLASDA